MKTTKVLLTMLVIAVAGCGGSNTGPSETPTPLQISGFVSQFAVVPTSSGNYADINYEVTITSNRATTGCFIKVQWLDANDLQIGFTYVGADVPVPAGTSKMTNQDFEDIVTARSIKDSRVEFSLCS